MKIKFILIIITVGFFSCIQSDKVEDQELVKTYYKEQSEFINLPEKDTVWREFYLEDTLRYGIRFGMTVSEWNRNFAYLAKEGIFDELNKGDFGSYQGVLKLNFNDEHIRKMIFKGLFEKSEEQETGLEILRRNMDIIEEPILIEVEVKYDIPSFDIEEFLNVMILKDNLKLIAGNTIKFNYEQPSLNDYREPLNPLEKLALEHGTEPENHPSGSSTQKALYEGDNFYSVMKVTRNSGATLHRDRDYNVISIENPYRYYNNLTQILYSKKQSNLNISDYFTDYEKRQIEKKENTEKLIKDALGK